MKRHIFPIILLAVMAACSSADEPLASGPILVDAKPGLSLAWTSSRAVGDEIDADMPQTIGVFAIRDGFSEEIFDNQEMYYRHGEAVKASGINVSAWPAENDWPYEPPKPWVGGKNYKFYAYTPYDPDYANIVRNGFNYESFLLTHIPPISATEYAVCAVSTEVEAGNAPKFQLLHITSRLRFKFAIGEEYNKMRDIYVKRLKISDEGHNTAYWEIEVNLSSPGELAPRESSETYLSAGDITLAPLQWDDPAKPGLKLTTDYQPFSSAYNLLKGIEHARLTVEYDVYDKEGVLTRQNQITSNSIDLSALAGADGFERGKCYDVKILITPKYLYVLSGNDVQPDGILDVK